jgi:carbamoylphosphate synthase large subunit
VVIWGVHSPDWMDALASGAPVWRRCPGVRTVLLMSSPNAKISWWTRWGRRIVVIPLMEEHLLGYPRQYASLVPTPEALKTLGDKAHFADYVRRQGLAELCPQHYASPMEVRFPCVIKRTNLNGGHGVEIAASLEHANALIAREPFSGHPVLWQELVKCAVEYVVHGVCLHGRVIWHRVYARDVPEGRICRSGDGSKLRRASIPDRVMAKLEALLLPLHYSGPFNADCTWDEAGWLKVFEINPRLGGSLMRVENTDHLAECLSVVITHAVGV